jgi:hypothetical protein
MSHPTNELIAEMKQEAEQEKDLHEQAGLIKAGLNEDGEQEWIGTDEKWRFYEQLEAHANE